MQFDIDAVRFAAEQGDTVTQTYLGTTYLRGEGGSWDYAEAAKWFRLVRIPTQSDQSFRPDADHFCGAHRNGARGLSPGAE